MTGAHCHANGEEIHLNEGGFFQTQAEGKKNQNALMASRGGAIHGNGLEILAEGTSHIGVAATGGGRISLSGSTNIRAWRGVHAHGPGSLLQMDGGNIQSTGLHAIYIEDHAHVALDGVDIDYTGTADKAVKVRRAGSFSMQGGSIVTTHGALKLLGDGFKNVTLTGVNISNANTATIDQESGHVDLRLDGGTTLHHTARNGQTAIALTHANLVMDDAHIVSAGDRASGISTQHKGGTSTVVAQNFSIDTIGAFAHGMQDGYAGGVFTLRNGSIRTHGRGASGILLGSVAPTFDAEDMTIATAGEAAHAFEARGGVSTLVNSAISAGGNNAYGLASSGKTTVIRMQGATLAATGAEGAYAAYAERGGNVQLDGVTITTAQAGSAGVLVYNGARGTVKNSQTVSQGHGAVAMINARLDIANSQFHSSAGHYGLRLQQGAQVFVKDSTFTADGTGLLFLDLAGSNHATLEKSALVAQAAFAVDAQGGVNTLNLLDNSRVAGDALALARDFRNTPARLTLNADNSVLAGHTRVTDTSTLSLNLENGAMWTLRPQVNGNAQSTVTFLSVDGSSSIHFDAPAHAFAQTDPPDPPEPQYQALYVGSGDSSGSTAVYQAANQGAARIVLNTRLDAGGALAAQQTDRLIINGDASGTTLLAVKPAADSTGATTGETAGDGISLVQVYGQTQSTAFALAGEYVAVGPYQYHLHAFDPDTSDMAQSVFGTGARPFWDFRLQALAAQAEEGKGGGEDLGFGPDPEPEPKPEPEPDLKPEPEPEPEDTADWHTGKNTEMNNDNNDRETVSAPPLALVPQIPAYLAAPAALFQAGMADIDTWHRRMGDGQQAHAPVAEQGTRDAFLRTYGGEWDYRASRNRYSYRAQTRYRAVQLGGNFYARDTENGAWRAGLAASSGQLSFSPRHIDGGRATRMKLWSIASTATWQHALGGYVDMVLAWGKFRGDVHTRQRGKTATLKGSRMAASVEFGRPYAVSGVVLMPQAQVTYQRLAFKRVRDVDGIDLALGKLEQWRLRIGSEIRKAWRTRADDDVLLYAKVHAVHTLGDGARVYAARPFQIGRSGAALETGLGVDAAFAKGRKVVYADVTRQHRIGGRGHQGWGFNAGARVRF